MNTWRPLMRIDGERRQRRRKKATATGSMELARRNAFALSMSGETEIVEESRERKQTGERRRRKLEREKRMREIA